MFDLLEVCRRKYEADCISGDAGREEFLQFPLCSSSFLVFSSMQVFWLTQGEEVIRLPSGFSSLIWPRHRFLSPHCLLAPQTVSRLGHGQACSDGSEVHASRRQHLSTSRLGLQADCKKENSFLMTPSLT